MPTTSIVIGYGAFGREVLRRLLVSSAGRGVLSWEEAEGGQDPALRRLRGLGLVWVPDLPGLGDSSQDAESLGSGVFGVLDDLYQQVEELQAGPRMGQALTEALDTEARRLLRASSRAGSSQDAPLMLNVILAARPQGPEAVGALNDLISGPMERLASYPNLHRPQEGGDLLNFIQLLDFDHFWGEDPSARSLRQAVRLSVQRWQKRSQQGEPGYGRIYLADSYTGEGVRDARHRLDELVLFLELLIFESTQTGLETLYRRQRDLLSPLSGFGVRAVEQNTELLSRLAAARFAQAWLHYLAEEEAPDGSSAGLSQLRDLLAPYRRDALPELLAEEDLRRQVEADFDALGQQLIDLPPDLPDWGKQIRRRCHEGIDSIQDDLFQRSGSRLAEIRQSALEPFPHKLSQAVTEALQNASEPATLAQVIGHLEQAVAEVLPHQPPPVQPPPPQESDPIWEELDAYQARYRDFKSTQVEPQMHRRRWPALISMLFAAAMTPLMARAIAHWKDSGNYMLEAFHGWLSPPFVMLPLLLVLAFAVAFFAVPRLLDRRTRRGLRFFIDSQRGRRAALIRQLLAPGSSLRAPLDEALERRVFDFSYSVRGFVGSEVERALQRLRERRREMLWLRGQLSEYLRIHAAESSESQAGEGRSSELGPVVLQLESPSELERILQCNPPRRQRFRSTQSQVLLFKDWQERFSGSFLYPLQFLDGPLSKIYRERRREDQQSEGRQADEARRSRLAASIEKQCRFEVGFHWPAGPKAPEENRLALLPAEWARPAEVEEALKANAFRRRFRSIGKDRAYLVRVHLAVSPLQLVRREKE